MSDKSYSVVNAETDNPLYSITVPAVFSRNTLSKADWPTCREQLLVNLLTCYVEIIKQIEHDVLGEK